jgi:hypothetical protein
MFGWYQRILEDAGRCVGLATSLDTANEHREWDIGVEKKLKLGVRSFIARSYKPVLWRKLLSTTGDGVCV